VIEGTENLNLSENEIEVLDVDLNSGTIFFEILDKNNNYKPNT